MTINSDVQKSAHGKRLELYDLDATALGGDVYHFTRGLMDDGSPVIWRGNTYMPRDIKAEGFKVSSEGGLPRPHVTVSHINSALIGLVLSYQDLLGAVVTRWVTFEHYVDNGITPNPDSHFPVDVFVIDRKVAQDRTSIEWELVAAIDQEGKKLPKRQIIRDACRARYRAWTGAEFSYDNADCPYAGTNYFDAMGNPCAAADDRCGKRLSDCKLRFGALPLPFWGFPGVARTRI
jgi:lambda family phage minor tail protein L